VSWSNTDIIAMPVEYFSRAPHPLAIVSRDGRIEDVNDAFAELTGYEIEALRSRKLADLVSPEHREDLIPQLDRAVGGLGSVLKTTVPIRRSDSECLWTTISIQSVSDSSEVPAYLIVSMEDISSHMSAELQARKAAAVTETTLNSMRDGILVTRPDGRIVSYNRRLIQMWSADDILSEMVSDMNLVNHIAHHLRQNVVGRPHLNKSSIV